MSTPQRYRKKPISVEAMQFTTDNGPAIRDWLAEYGVNATLYDNALVIVTLGNARIARLGDWILRNGEDNFTTCLPDTFDSAYDEEGEEA